MTQARVKNFLIWFIVLFVAGYYGLILLDHPILEYSDILEISGSVIAVAALAYVVRRHSPQERLPWAVFLVAVFLYVVGESLWAYFAHTTGEPDVPSICDVFYLADTALCLIAVIIYLRQIRKVDLFRLSFDVFLSAFASAGIIFIAVVMPIMQDATVSLPSTVVQICYPIGDILMLLMFFIIFFSAEHLVTQRKAYMVLGLYCLLSLLADQVNLVNDIYELGIALYLDPLWGTIMPVCALAGLYDLEPRTESQADPERQTENRTTTLDRIRVALPYVLTFSILGYVCVLHEMTDIPSLWAIALFVLLSLRQIMVILSNERLLLALQKNERSLNQKNRELEKLNQQVLHDTQVDFLTQVFNRRRIGDLFEQLAPKGEEPESMGLMLIDVDHFKHVNDTYGHQVGDEVLKRVAVLICATLGDKDITGRYGGDEFIAILPGADEPTVAAAGHKLLADVRGDKALSRRGVTISVGCSNWCVNRSGYRIETLLKTTDEALYSAKEGGRNQVRAKAVRG